MGLGRPKIFHEVATHLEAMAAMAGEGGLIPEQVWDQAPLPGRGLAPGRPTGSAMPLVWAHAEFVKLIHSRGLGRPFDRPAAVWERYRGRPPKAYAALWCPQARLHRAPVGRPIRVCSFAPALVHWGIDGWQDVTDVLTRDTGLGLHVAELDTTRLKPGQHVEFTLRERAGDHWEGRDHRIEIVAE